MNRNEPDPLFERAKRIQAERERHVLVVTETLMLSVDALQVARLELEAKPDMRLERVLVACHATQQTVLLLLTGFQSLRDFGICGALRYPGLRDWFESPDAKRALGALLPDEHFERAKATVNTCAKCGQDCGPPRTINEREAELQEAVSRLTSAIGGLDAEQLAGALVRLGRAVPAKYRPVIAGLCDAWTRSFEDEW